MKKTVKVYLGRSKLLTTIGHKDYWYFKLSFSYDPRFSRVSHLVKAVADNFEKIFSETGDEALTSFEYIYQAINL